MAVDGSMEPVVPGSDKWDLISRIIGALLITMLLLFAGTSLVLLLSQSEERSEQTDTLLDIARENRRNGDRLIDCTTPGGVCYETGQKQTANAIASIFEADKQVAIIAAVCAQVSPPEIEAVRACVDAELAKASP
jgi:hypothetical protein